MKIVYIFDDSYISQFITVTNSILSNEKKELSPQIEFYITYFGNKETANHLSELTKVHFPNNKFYFKHIPSEFPDLIKKYNSNYNMQESADHIQTSSVLCRFDLDKIWSEINGKVIYLDLDLIVTDSISKIYEELNESGIIHACRDKKLAFEIRSIPYDEPLPQSHLYNFINDIKNNYINYLEKTPANQKILQEIISTEYNLNQPAFNAGVFVLDLKKYRENKHFKNFANFLIEINKYGNIFRHNDQSILNIIFYNHVDFIDSKWNCTDYGWYNERYSYDIQDDFNYASVIHFCGPDKPWQNLLNDKSPEYIRYFSKGIQLWRKYEIKEKQSEQTAISIDKFYELNLLDEAFDEVEYARIVPETINFYQPYCNNNFISDKKRLYYHYNMYGKSHRRFHYLTDKNMILVNSIIGMAHNAENSLMKSSVVETLNLCKYIEGLHIYKHQTKRKDVIKMLELLIENKIFSCIFNEEHNNAEDRIA